MSSEQRSPVAPVPGHLHSVTPRLVVRDAARAIDFYRAAFGAEELGERFTDPHGEVVHAEVRIGDSVIMLSDETDNGAPVKSPRSLGNAVTTIMATYWKDVDAAWQQALAAGAEVVFPLADQFTATGPGGCAIRALRRAGMRVRPARAQRRQLQVPVDNLPSLARPDCSAPPRPAAGTGRSTSPGHDVMRVIPCAFALDAGQAADGRPASRRRSRGRPRLMCRSNSRPRRRGVEPVDSLDDRGPRPVELRRDNRSETPRHRRARACYRADQAFGRRRKQSIRPHRDRAFHQEGSYGLDAKAQQLMSRRHRCGRGHPVPPVAGRAGRLRDGHRRRHRPVIGQCARHVPASAGHPLARRGDHSSPATASRARARSAAISSSPTPRGTSEPLREHVPSLVLKDIAIGNDAGWVAGRAAADLALFDVTTALGTARKEAS